MRRSDNELQMEQQTNGGKLEASADDEIGDDLLRSYSLPAIRCCPPSSHRAHPAAAAGLTTDEIARAFLVRKPPSRSASCGQAHAQRRARAFEIPRRASSPRAVLGARIIYLVFNEAIRPPRRGLDAAGLCEEAQRIGRILPSSRRWSRKFTDSWR